MRLMIMTMVMVGAVSCAPVSDAAFCGPAYSGAIERLADALPNPATPDGVGIAGTAVILAHDAGCGG